VILVKRFWAKLDKKVRKVGWSRLGEKVASAVKRSPDRRKPGE
jgi:hypothetical protein